MVLHRPAELVLKWYRDQGFPVYRVDEVRALPDTVVEERVSRLRYVWRTWLWGESALSIAVGPAGLIVGVPTLSLVLMGWAVDMGWSYGLNMDDSRRIAYVQETIFHGLEETLGLGSQASRDVRNWRRLGTTVLFWGCGTEFAAADRVMARVRTVFRSQRDQARNHSP